MKSHVCLSLTVLLLAGTAGCSGDVDMSLDGGEYFPYQEASENYAEYEENPFVYVSGQPVLPDLVCGILPGVVYPC